MYMSPFKSLKLGITRSRRNTGPKSSIMARQMLSELQVATEWRKTQKSSHFIVINVMDVSIHGRISATGKQRRRVKLRLFQ